MKIMHPNHLEKIVRFLYIFNTVKINKSRVNIHRSQTNINVEKNGTSLVT